MAGYSVSGKNVIVTGGSLGLGEAIVRQLLEEKAKHITIFDVLQSEGERLVMKLREQFGENTVDFIKCDMTKEEEVASAYERVVKERQLDVVINNAGVYCEQNYKEMIDINLTAVISSTLKALQVMRADDGGAGGTIVNVSSIAALGPTHLFPLYGATKAGVLFLSNSMGMEPLYSRTKVRVLSICPARVATRLANITERRCWDPRIKIEIDSLFINAYDQTPEEAAKAVIHAFKEGDSGTVWTIDNGKAENVSNKSNVGSIPFNSFFD